MLLGLVIGHQAFEVEPAGLVFVVLDGIDNDRVLALELALEQFLTQRVLDIILDGPAERPRTEIGV